MTLKEMAPEICLGHDCNDCPLFDFDRDCRALSINNANEKTAAALIDIYNSLFNKTTLIKLSEDDILNVIEGE